MVFVCPDGSQKPKVLYIWFTCRNYSFIFRKNPVTFSGHFKKDNNPAQVMLIVGNEKARCFRKIIARKINTRLEMRFKTGESLVKVVSFSENRYNGKIPEIMHFY